MLCQARIRRCCQTDTLTRATEWSASTGGNRQRID
jgi:hypothetical protein